MNRITIAMPYFDNPAMLRRHQQEWANYPEEIRAHMHVVIVDDGSPEHPAHEAIHPAVGYVLELYRILEDIPWNQIGARNLALDRAPDDPVLMTDIDHLLERDAAAALWAATIEPDRYYILGRRKPDGSAYHSHPNSFIMHRSLFWETGGGNEDFARLYGSDSIFRARIAMFGRSVGLPEVKLTVFNLAGEDIGGIPGAASSLPRKGSKYHLRGNEAMKRKAARAHLVRPERPLRFKWERML